MFVKIEVLLLVVALVILVSVWISLVLSKRFGRDVSNLNDKVAQEKTIKIGIYEATSGKLSDQGKQEVMGIELANELYGTVLNKKVELIYGDNQSSMYVGETVIQELISQNPSVILGGIVEVYGISTHKT